MLKFDSVHEFAHTEPRFAAVVGRIQPPPATLDHWMPLARLAAQ